MKSNKSSHYAISSKQLLLLILSSILFFIFLSSVINLSRKYFTLRAKVKELNQEQLDIQRKQAVLNEQNAYLLTDEGTDHTLRQKYNLVKPGEEVIIVSDSEASTDTSKQTAHSFFGSVWHGILRGLGIEH